MRLNRVARLVSLGSLAVFLLIARSAGAEPHSMGDPNPKHPMAPSVSAGDLTKRAAELEAQVKLLQRVAELEAQLKELQKTAGKAPAVPNVTDLTKSRKMYEVGIAHNCMACNNGRFALGVPQTYSVKNSENACESALSECNRSERYYGKERCHIYNPAQAGTCGPRSYNSDGRVIENRYECRYRRIGGFSQRTLTPAASGVSRDQADERALLNCTGGRQNLECVREYCRAYVEVVER